MIRQNDIDGYLAVARKDLDENRVKSSIKELSKVEKLDPDNLEAQYLLGIAFSRLGEYEAAVTRLERVIHSEYGYLHVQQACMLLGLIAVRRELWDEAEQYFLRVLRFNFNNDAACSALGHVYFMKNEVEKSIQILQQALKLNPENHNARNSLAYVYCEGGGDLERALIEAMKASKAEPRNYAYLDTMGWLYYKKGKETLARETLKRALELAPENEEIKEHLRIVLGISQDQVASTVYR